MGVAPMCTTGCDVMCATECACLIITSAVRIELSNISKTIAGLLSLPMTSVASRLRELRASQDQKVWSKIH